MDDEDNKNILEEVSKDELKAFLHSFQKYKSVGLDGWSKEFFIGLIDIVGYVLLHVIKQSIVQGRILPAFNYTFIAFIPKVDKPL